METGFRNLPQPRDLSTHRARNSPVPLPFRPLREVICHYDILILLMVPLLLAWMSIHIPGYSCPQNTAEKSNICRY